MSDALGSFTLVVIAFPFQFGSITEENKPFQSGSVFYEAFKLTGALYKHRVIFTVDGLIITVLIIFFLDI